VIAGSFERIHRTNLVGMGVLPLQFRAGEKRRRAGADRQRTFHIEGVAAALNGGGRRATVRAVPATVRRRSSRGRSRGYPQEVEYYRNGGILPYVPAPVGERVTTTIYGRTPGEFGVSTTAGTSANATYFLACQTPSMDCGQMVSCAPVFNRRWSACLQAVRAGYQPAAGCKPAPQFLSDSRIWEKYVALATRAPPRAALGHAAWRSFPSRMTVAGKDAARCARPSNWLAVETNTSAATPVPTAPRRRGGFGARSAGAWSATTTRMS